ncbi:MAG TPA: efflux RND transporter permease subunit [Gemmatimonadaceae bacterium]|jgi:hydrophobic/amphiphilic exporter-1 (mainly G- bacteria), HAE1 family|nr:efflux RND transporter permease subunit [Gemmatimonadaceae bacterium]
MVISDFAIKRPMITVVAMVALVVFGLFALWRLQTDEFPDIQQPVVLTFIPYPGASPEGVEREVLKPVEDAIKGISGVDQIFGTAGDGYAQIITLFLFEKDPQVGTQDIRDAISGIRADLPVEMKEPILQRFDPADIPIVSITMNSQTMTPAQLTRLADPGITSKLKGIPGVAQVRVVGGVKREMTIQLKPEALQAAGVSVGEVVGALQAQNLAVPVGSVNGDLQERAIRLQGRLEGPQDFENLVVTERNGQIIRLGQVANAIDGTQEQRSIALYNGVEGIGIDVVKSKGYSTTDVSNKIRAQVADLQKTLPPGVKMDIVRDAGKRVQDSVRNVEEALLEGALLTVLVVFVFLNSWRSTVITGLALPVSVMASFIAVWAFGFTLNTMSLLGLSLAIGILIDDAIVVRENIVRHIEMGKDHVTASHEGTDEIGLAVAATTFSIVAVFVPIAFMYGVAGQWFKPFALTIASSVLVSLFVSFSLDPMLSAYWPDPQVEAHERRNPIARTLDRFNAWFNRMAEKYKGLVAWALDHRVAMVLIATASFVGALALPALGLVGASFFGTEDQSEVIIALETPPGSNLNYTQIKAEEAARIARSHKDIVRFTYTTTGGQTGDVNVGQVYVRLVPKADRKIGAEDFGRQLRKEVGQIGGAQMSVFTNTFGGDQKQIQIQLRGGTIKSMTPAAELIADQLRNIKGVVDIGLSTKGQKPELSVDINRGLAGSLGVTVAQVAQSLRPAFAGIKAGDWVDPSDETREVNVRLAPEARQRASDLEQLPIVVMGPNGRPETLPLGQIATVTQSLGPAQVSHLDSDPVVTVQANTSGRPLTEVMRDITAKIAKITLPPGVRITQGGEAKDQAEVFGRIFSALGIAVMLMYLILVMQFGSFLEPLAIMASLPLSLIGVMLALMFTNTTINIMSLIGVILLMGIVAKNAILLIDFAKWAREKEGVTRREALIQAGAIRLRPILMTTLALIAGMIPVALGVGEGAEFRAPLGRAVIGGVITSTLLTLVVIPTFYEILDEWREWVFRRFGVYKPRTAEHPIPRGVHPAPAGERIEKLA